MLSIEELQEIVTKVANGTIKGIEYIPSRDLYALNIDYDPGETDPHKKKTMPSVLCVNGSNKQVEYVDMLTYFDYLDEGSQKIRVS